MRRTKAKRNDNSDILDLHLQYIQVTKVDECVFWQVRADNTGNNSKKGE